VDHVIVLPHWGYCNYTYPALQTVQLGEALLDAGVSAVVGHHSHVVQGSRTCPNGQYIAYSLGNFFFADYPASKTQMEVACGENAQGAVLRLRFSKTRCEESYWSFTSQEQSTLALDTDPQRGKTLAKRSEPLQYIETYGKFWRSVVRKRMCSRVLFWLNPVHWRRLKIATLVSAFIMLKNLVVTKSKDKTK
jgi:hypothetical protein